jgi:negative regulator of flagellin synthesis FlgM
MDRVNPVNSSTPTQTVNATEPLRRTAVAEASALQQDHVEISAIARALDALENAPDIRVQKVADVRKAVDEGRYETPEKLAITVDRLLREFNA